LLVKKEGTRKGKEKTYLWPKRCYFCLLGIPAVRFVRFRCPCHPVVIVGSQDNCPKALLVKKRRNEKRIRKNIPVAQEMSSTSLGHFCIWLAF
jgi:hypothetical protein